VQRRGKNILLDLSGGFTMHVHLRMTGNFYVIPDALFRPLSSSAWFTLDDGRGLLFQDQRGLGTLRIYDAEGRRKLVDSLGPEPLSRQFTAARFLAAASASRQPAKLFLMDQQRVAGLGNIYAAEALFAAQVDPRQPMADVSQRQLRNLHQTIVRILRDAVKSACIAYSRPGNFGEAEDYSPLVYGREGEACMQCKRTIRRISQGGRSTYYCPHCQR
ncbi:MAG: DNA-formamidopyrimidine glycosylase family protein, partial [Bryobacteraceae bacterium]